MNTSGCEKKRAARQNWISLLGSADRSRLETAWSDISPKVSHALISGPETGLIMVRARQDGSGPRFNLGEMSVSRCVLKVDDTFLGYGMVMGSDLEHARLAALFDGLLQHPDFGPALRESLVPDLDRMRQAQEREARAQAARTRVEFFTLKRGE